MTDYKWQQKALFRFAKSTISGIIAACGTGKTRAEIRLALAKALPVIVIVPKNITKEWEKEIKSIVGPNEKIWIHSVPTETKEGAKYLERFAAWLKPETEELRAMEARARSSNE